MNFYSIQRPMDKKLKPEGLPKKYEKILNEFFQDYRKVIGEEDSIFRLFVQFVQHQLKHPFVFEPYHQKMRHPTDYYKFGLDFIRPLIDLPHSRVEGKENLERIDQQLKRG